METGKSSLPRSMSMVSQPPLLSKLSLVQFSLHKSDDNERVWDWWCLTNHIKFSALPPSLFLSNPTIALGNQTLETQSLGFDDNLYSPILITVQHCSTSELEVAQVKARWDISLIKTREQSRTGQGWSNCTSIIPLRALQLLPWARLDWPCKDMS